MSFRGATADIVQATTYEAYLHEITHRWMRTLALLGILLVPLFFILDVVVIQSDLLTRFALYRGVATAAAIVQVIILSNTRPSKAALFHGFVFSFMVGGAITLMTTDLGGFNSRYYAGINLVLMGANLLLPWEWWHATINSIIVIGSYVLANLLLPTGEPAEFTIALNNMYFLCSTAFISVAINFVKGRLIKAEFGARAELKVARDSLWSEMAVAKQIQTALLPRLHALPGYSVAATMLPADEVGGDYYDVIETTAGESWLAIGDVSGHGVESGLIMMMTQTSIFTTIDQQAGLAPSEVLARANHIIKENMARMSSARYMTITALRLDDHGVTFAGKHQDLLVYRAASGTVEIVTTPGTWIGIIDDLRGHLDDNTLTLAPGDVLLLFTDGVTEATDAAGEMYSDERLHQALTRHAALPVDQLVAALTAEVLEYLHQQDDDITLVALKHD